MYPGQYTLCLKTTDLPAMQRFYEALGMEVHSQRTDFVLLNNGDLDLALMTFLPEHCLNFRGADVSQVFLTASAQGQEFTSEPQRYKKEQFNADADGSSWLETDPDGNNVFFDTNENEQGAQGAALALQRVLDSTAKQLINIGASEACRDTFHNKILEHFVPPEKRIKTDVLHTLTLTEPGMFAGFFSYCLKTSNNKATRRFYEALGIEITGNNDDSWVSMGTADSHIDLMTFLEENWLNFRGANIFEMYERLQTAGLDLEGNPETYTSDEYGSPGAHWRTRDPDGNVVYFDTTEAEQIKQGDPALLSRLCKTTLARLQAIAADPACISTFKTEIA
jgi:catechol 2,3-dioxygenase-like lactoylglutathione lyase family enzyme